MSVSRSAPTRIALREITLRDRDEVIDVLTRGYGETPPRGFWATAFDRLAWRPAPGEYPRFGFALESDGRIVGVLLLIFARITDARGTHVRCNGSSLYVEPDYRLYTPLLTSATNKYKEVTVLNVSAAPHTHPMVRAQGFRPYSHGIFYAVPLASRALTRTSMTILDARETPDAAMAPWEHELLLEHRAYGCDALWCVDGNEAIPFVFKRSHVRGSVRSARLIHARSLDSLVHCVPALGRFYAKRLCFVLTIDASDRLPLPGRFRHERDIRFFRGPNPPSPGDLAFTELAVLDHDLGWSSR